MVISQVSRRKLKKSAKRKTLEATGHPTLGPNFGDLIQFGSDDGITSHTDLVILAGDIDFGPLSADYAGGLSDWLGVPVILIAGNHEFYGGEYFSTIKSLRNQSLQYTGLNFLERDRLDLEHADGPVRVLGCILWTDFLLFGEDMEADEMLDMGDLDGAAVWRRIVAAINGDSCDRDGRV